jgi:uncharacterized protein
MTVQPIELRESLSSDLLHLILLPTEACNFRCVYCYETFRLKRMERGVVDGVKRLIERRAASLGRLTLSWFGGEPLLAADLVEEVLVHVRALQTAHPALQLVSDITTNGSLLTVPLLERLVALGVSDYQITFVGPRRFHDRRRVRAGGAATFDTIWGRLEDASRSASPFRIQVRLHVDRDNEAAIPEFLEAFVSAFGHDERFNLFIRGLSRLGGPRDESLPILEGESRSVTIESLRNRARDLGIRLAPVPEHSTICYAARGNSFIVRADGRINKCTVALDHPANQVGTIGEDGALQLRAEAVRPWMRGLFSGDRGLMACPKRGLADGTIPLAAAADRRRVAAAVEGAA